MITMILELNLILSLKSKQLKALSVCSCVETVFTMDNFACKILEIAKEDKELLEFYNLTKDSKPHKIVAAYILFYFPTSVSREICEHF